MQSLKEHAKLCANANVAKMSQQANVGKWQQVFQNPALVDSLIVPPLLLKHVEKGLAPGGCYSAFKENLVFQCGLC
jgi:hypothetical protein